MAAEPALAAVAAGEPPAAWRPRWAAAVPLLPLLVLLVGWPSLDAAFQFDDWHVIVGDARVHSWSAWWHSMPGIRPLLKASYALGWEMGGSPATFRAFNLLLHAANALLLAALLRRRALAAGVHVAAAWLAAALAAPLLLWAWEATSPPGTARTAMGGWIAWCLPVAALVACGLAWPPYRQLLEASLAQRPLGSNLLTQAHAWPWLAGQWVMPWRLDADPHLPVVQAAAPADVALLLAWLAFAAAAIAWRRRWPRASFALLWCLACLAPTNSLLPRADVANDRQLYLALAGPAWALAATAVRWPRRLWVPAACLLLAALAAGTLARNRAYATEESYWRAALERSPGNARAANNLGMALATRCDEAGARAWFARAAQLDPRDPRPRINGRLLAAGQLLEPGERHCARRPDGAE